MSSLTNALFLRLHILVPLGVYRWTHALRVGEGAISFKIIFLIQKWGKYEHFLRSEMVGKETSLAVEGVEEGKMEKMAY